MKTLNLPLTIKVFYEGSSKEAPYVAYNPEFDISSCGKTEEKAGRALTEAIELLIDGAKEDGTLNQLLEEAGFALRPNQKKNFLAKTYFSVLSLSFNA